MPAASEIPSVSLPHTFWPLGVRVAVYVLGSLLLATVMAIWLAFSADTRAEFTLFQRGTVVAVGVGLAAGGHALTRSRIIASRERVTVVNGFRTRRYDWNQVLAISLRTGAPWAVLDLSDGTSSTALGIQGSDGARAVRQVRQMRGLIAQQSRTDRDD
jgi:hypothetical protein